jgi:hypothetical protein
MAKLTAAILGLMLVIGVGPVYAQAPTDQPRPMAAAPGTGVMADPHGAGMMPMMDMCRQMMSGSMGMGMTGDQKMDPKMMAHMLQMRGEMMKAMGDVMMKHGTMMQGDATK